MCCSPQRPARAHKRWPLAAMAELHHARFLLQPSALELFLADRANALLSFPSPEVRYRSTPSCKAQAQRYTRRQGAASPATCTCKAGVLQPSHSGDLPGRPNQDSLLLPSPELPVSVVTPLSKEHLNTCTSYRSSLLQVSGARRA